MADENRMITFAYAKANWDQFKKQTIPDSLECMTKSDISDYLNADLSGLASYANNQLVPRSKFVGINPINRITYESYPTGTNGASLNKPTYAESIQFVRDFGSSGVEFILNNGTPTTTGHAKIYIDDTNKHLPKKVIITCKQTVNDATPQNFSKTDGVINGRGGKIVTNPTDQNSAQISESITYTLPQPIPHNLTLGNFGIFLFYVVGTGSQVSVTQISFTIEVLDVNDNRIVLYNNNSPSSVIGKAYQIFRN